MLLEANFETELNGGVKVPEWIGITLLWTLLYGYLIMSSIDFGAGFFASYETAAGEKNKMSSIITRFLSPVWEGVSMCLLLIMVALVYFFSNASPYLEPALFIPTGIGLILMILRGLFYFLSSYQKGKSKVLLLIYGVLGLCIPTVLSSALTISEGGYLESQGGILFFNLNTFLTSFYAWSVILLSVVSVLYISAMFLTFYANRVGDPETLEKLRGYAIFWSGATLLASSLVFLALQQHNPEHFLNSLNYAWLFLLSLLCLLVAVTLVFRKRRLGLAFFLAALQYFFAFFGYGLSHLPYLIYPFIKLKSVSGLHGIDAGILMAVVMGLALLLPSVILVLRLFIFNSVIKKG